MNPLAQKRTNKKIERLFIFSPRKTESPSNSINPYQSLTLTLTLTLKKSSFNENVQNSLLSMWSSGP